MFGVSMTMKDTSITTEGHIISKHQFTHVQVEIEFLQNVLKRTLGCHYLLRYPLIPFMTMRDTELHTSHRHQSTHVQI